MAHAPQWMGGRSAGILLHPTSLPGPYGIGDLGPEVDRFLDWMVAAGQTVWQVLPLGPTGFLNSPYLSQSTFAGNPLLISPDRLVAEGLLPADALRNPPAFREDEVDFGAVPAWKESILRASWDRFRADASDHLKEQFRAFRRAPEQAFWLWDWTLFAALKQREGGAEWLAWPPDLAARSAVSLSLAATRLSPEVDFHAYVQFLFSRQWGRVRLAAAERGIRILGDVPIYVAPDSADVWANQETFQVDAQGRPTAVAGVPPDYFSAAGQLWGNPLYRWEALERNGFEWWVERVRAGLRTCDVLRVDHFRGFVAYWAVPAGEETAIHGRWVAGPGVKLFHTLRAALGDLPLVAEDLGVITDDVEALIAELGLPGMRVLQFGFGESDSIHLPHHFSPSTLVYTGTHDNDTTRGWWAALSDEARTRARDYLGLPESGDEGIEWALIRAAYESVAEWAIVPVQDVLGLGSGARMNLPARQEGNWGWRLRGSALGPGHAARLLRLVEVSGRRGARSAAPA
ncbi:MAG TPA: 4-alpha-glucanotransferase [Candidatus Eisenbacteria bacterium]|jgi:4-alpha-glucanotransferase